MSGLPMHVQEEEEEQTNNNAAGAGPLRNNSAKHLNIKFYQQVIDQEDSEKE
jgi:hypothetical protein